MRDRRREQMDAHKKVLDGFCLCGRPRMPHVRYCEGCAKRVVRTGSLKKSVKEVRAEILRRGLAEGFDIVTLSTLMHFSLRHVRNVERVLRRRGGILPAEQQFNQSAEPEGEQQPGQA